MWSKILATDTNLFSGNMKILVLYLIVVGKCTEGLHAHLMVKKDMFNVSKSWIVYIHNSLVYSKNICPRSGYSENFRKCAWNCPIDCKYLKSIFANNCVTSSEVKFIIGRISVPCNSVSGKWINIDANMCRRKRRGCHKEIPRMPIIRNIWKFNVDVNLKINLTFLLFHIGNDAYQDEDSENLHLYPTQGYYNDMIITGKRS